MSKERLSPYLDQRRIFHFRPNADALQSGLPDVIACYRGRFIGLEFKKLKTGRAQGHQKIISKEIANLWRNNSISYIFKRRSRHTIKTR